MTEGTTAAPVAEGGLLPDRVGVAGLEVRTWRASDVPALSAAITDSVEHLRPFMPWIGHEPLTDGARASRVAQWEADRLSGGDTVLGIWRDGRVVGGTGAHRRVAPDGVEIGYWLRADEQGRGTVTRVVTALTEALLDVPGITHVEIRHDVANTRSAAIPTRCGYRLVGRESRVAEAPADTGTGLVWRIGADPAPRA